MGNESSRVLRQEVLNELTSATSFCEAEIRRFYREFSEISQRNRKLTVDAQHLHNLYSQAFLGDATRFTRHVFRVMDKEGSGHVDFRDFILTLSVHFQGSSARKLLWLFTLIDADGDGYITPDDLLDMVEVSRHHPRRPAGYGRGK